MLTINPSELILTILNFFLLLFLLKRFFYTPLITFMNARRDRIQNALDQEKEAFDIVHELERLLASKRKDRQDEAKRILADAQTADKLRYDQAVAKAKEQLEEERKAESDAAFQRNSEEKRQLEEDRVQLGELLAKSLIDRFSQMPQVVFQDGRMAGFEARRKQRVLQAQELFAAKQAIGDAERKRNEEEQRQVEEQRGQLAALLAENLLEQFSNAPLVLYMDGRVVRGGQKDMESPQEQEPAFGVQHKFAAGQPCGTAQTRNLFAVGDNAGSDAELQRNQEEQQLLEEQWEQLAALLAERLLCPGA